VLSQQATDTGTLATAVFMVVVRAGTMFFAGFRVGDRFQSRRIMGCDPVDLVLLRFTEMRLGYHDAIQCRESDYQTVSIIRH
jgi:hypothetical protein